MSLLERYRRITAINACSTNYLSSQQLIVDYAKKHNVPQDELPETYCFSDEGFDPQIQGIFQRVRGVRVILQGVEDNLREHPGHLQASGL